MSPLIFNLVFYLALISEPIMPYKLWFQFIYLYAPPTPPPPKKNNMFMFNGVDWRLVVKDHIPKIVKKKYF